MVVVVAGCDCNHREHIVLSPNLIIPIEMIALVHIETWACVVRLCWRVSCIQIEMLALKKAHQYVGCVTCLCPLRANRSVGVCFSHRTLSFHYHRDVGIRMRVFFSHRDVWMYVYNHRCDGAVLHAYTHRDGWYVFIHIEMLALFKCRRTSVYIQHAF